MVRSGRLVVLAVMLTLPLIVPSAQPMVNATYRLLPTGELASYDAGVDPMAGTATLVSSGAEPHILVDKLGRSILIGDHTGVYVSLDGGASFFDSTPLYIDSRFIADGWALAQDDVGTIYASTTNGGVINVASSTNGGLSWQLASSTLAVDPGAIADRPWMAARGAGQVALVWNEGGQWNRCSYTTTGGLLWNRAAPGPFTWNYRPIAGIPAFDATGRLVFAGNGGVGGGAATLYRHPQSVPCGTGATFALQSIALPPVGAQLSTHVVANAEGIYLAAPTADNGAMTIIAYPGWTTNGMKRLTVSPPSLKNNVFGTIALRDNGELAVSWYSTPTAGDFQNGNFLGHWNVTTARVQNFWSASPTIVFQQVTTQANHVGSICMLGTNCDIFGGDRDLLDYFATDYDTAGNLHIAYSADGAGDSTQTRTYYAKLPALT